MLFGKRQHFDWGFLLAASDIAVTLVSVFVTAFLFHALPPFFGHPVFDAYPAWRGRGMIFVLLLFFLMRRAMLYTWATLNDPLARPFRFLWASVAAGAVLMGLDTLLGTRPPGTFRWTILQVADAALLLWLSRMVMHHVLLNDRLGVIPKERIAFVGMSTRMQKVLHAMQKQMGRFQTVVGYFGVLHPLPPEETAENPFSPLGGIENLEAAHAEEGITLLIVDARLLSPQELRDLIATTSRLTITFRMIPNTFDAFSLTLKTRLMGGVAVMGLDGFPLDLLYNRGLKRVVDIVGALVGLALSAPIMLVLGILINLESPGSIFYTQVRMGWRGKPFRIIKLRSMKLNAEKGNQPGWTVENDPRRLRIGGFMRKWNLDEVPQFWNVLMGDMSLVGPRPERPEFVARFEHDIRHYNLRHHCKPGITSWAAVNGWRGDTSLTDRIHHDLYYLENWSLTFDFQIMIRTLMPPKNAY